MGKVGRLCEAASVSESVSRRRRQRALGYWIALDYWVSFIHPPLVG